MTAEDNLQSKCYVWFSNTYPQYRGLLFSVPNGGGRSSLEGKVLKMTGLYKGVSDLIFLFNGKAYMIEMKTPTGIQSDAQKEWEVLVNKAGFDYFVIKSFNAFRGLIESIIQSTANATTPT